MLQMCHCAKCDNNLGFEVDAWPEKALFITLKLDHVHKACDACCHTRTIPYNVFFCSVDCLKAFVAEDLDKYIEAMFRP